MALATTASAQGKGAGAPKAPHTTTTSAPKGGGQTHVPKSGPSISSGKSANAGSPKKPTDGPASAKHGSSDESNAGSPHAKKPDAPVADAPANNLATKLTNNPAQLAKIQPQLDALGLTLEEATAGFRNQGQFIAALNAAKNRNLDFVALQEAMTVEGLSLGQAAKKVANTPPPAETPEGDAGTGTGGTGTGGTGTTGTGTTGTGTTGTGSTGTGSTGTSTAK
jgi:hypothetical protein